MFLFLVLLRLLPNSPYKEPDQLLDQSVDNLYTPPTKTSTLQDSPFFHECITDLFTENSRGVSCICLTCNYYQNCFSIDV